MATEAARKQLGVKRISSCSQKKKEKRKKGKSGGKIHKPAKLSHKWRGNGSPVSIYVRAEEVCFGRTFVQIALNYFNNRNHFYLSLATYIKKFAV